MDELQGACEQVDRSPVTKLTKPFTLLGFGLILLGALSIYAPQQSGMTVGVLVGVFLIFSGLLRTVFFWVATSLGSAILRLVMGLVAVVAGGVMIADPALGLLPKWIEDYNRVAPHSALGQMSPMEYRERKSQSLGV